MPKSKVILIIEDDEDYQRLVSAVLTRSEEAFSVRTARTQGEGIGLPKQSSPHVILVDLNLPDSAGYETFLRVQEHADGAPIIVLTGLDDDHTAIQAVWCARHCCHKARKSENSSFRRRSVGLKLGLVWNCDSGPQFAEEVSGCYKG